MNTTCLTGRLGNNPELKYFDSGKVKASFSIAVKGKKKDEAHWINIEAWDKTAELIGEHFKKGSQIGIQGRLQVDNWEKDGEKRSKVYVVAEQIDFLDPK
ncbi:MAG: Single-stranded DNA-binding protein [Candidatus Pacebacteria bacterium GW2011_GWF1_36_5]|nr:MAG: Single-stranded DNA-binding protein [Candidatus Pacebacteria bacterium GW2011_GWF1_36_5]